MALRYASIENINKRLLGRLSFNPANSFGMGGDVTQEVDEELLDLIGQSIEDFIDLYLGMIYVLPLKRTHFFLNSIVEKMIVADIYSTYYPSTSEVGSPTDSFGNTLRQQALNEFQSLFNGLGIFVAGSTAETNSLSNDENRVQMTNKAIILPGEELKRFIGYDYNDDNVTDTDLFKLNTNVPPSFYTTGIFEKLDDSDDILNGVRVRPRGSKIGREDIEVDFW